MGTSGDGANGVVGAQQRQFDFITVGGCPGAQTQRAGDAQICFKVNVNNVKKLGVV